MSRYFYDFLNIREETQWKQTEEEETQRKQDQMRRAQQKAEQDQREAAEGKKQEIKKPAPAVDPFANFGKMIICCKILDKVVEIHFVVFELSKNQH